MNFKGDKKRFLIIFKGLSVAANCLRPVSESVKTIIFYIKAVYYRNKEQHLMHQKGDSRHYIF